MGKIHMEARAIRVYPVASGARLMDKKPRRNLKTCSPRLIPRWRHLDDLPIDQFSLAVDFVESSIVARVLALMGILLLVCSDQLYTISIYCLCV